MVDDKWLAAISTDVQTELDRVSQALTGRIKQLAERYATPLPRITEPDTPGTRHCSPASSLAVRRRPGTRRRVQSFARAGAAPAVARPDAHHVGNARKQQVSYVAMVDQIPLLDVIEQNRRHALHVSQAYPQNLLPCRRRLIQRVRQDLLRNRRRRLRRGARLVCVQTVHHFEPDRRRVRIADADRVRLGAHLAEGTTVMHEGFCNFNAGTLGTSMVEGRIVQGVVVGDGSDVGAGASIMGTLSGGGTARVSIGERCLLGANAGIGIALGDDCVVEAGLYVTAGTKVNLLDEQNQLVKVVKARELAGQPDLLFRRNSQTGAVECKTHKSAIELNEALHAHN